MGTATLVVNAVAGMLLAVLLARAIRFILALWTARRFIMRMRKLEKPMPPFNPILGHLLAGKTASEELPPGAHSMHILNRMTAKYGSTGAYYLDMFPVMTPILTVSDPHMANQVMNHPFSSAEKPPALIDWFLPITGGPNLFTQNGDAWRHDHNLFMPFFSNSNLDAAFPFVVEQMAIYRDKLRALSKSGELFSLEPLTLALMNDIIGRLVFNAQLGAQATAHPLSDTMIRQLNLKFVANGVVSNLGRLNPVKLFQFWNNGCILDTHIRAQINNRVAAYRSAKIDDEQASFKSILDIALETYYSQAGRRATDEVDADYLKMLCAQLRMFFFAGYDSTAATMVYCCYTIWKHPEVLAKLRAEHDAVFGRNVAAAMDMIADDPALLNSLPYTNAVIKETLRLFPAAAGIRQGCRDLVLKDEAGNEYPTESCGIQISHLSIQRNPKLWVRPLEFVPERFLVEPGHELYPLKGAWGPFGHGLRLCTGQALVTKEVKAFLVLLSREFNVKECYDEVDGDRKIDLTNVDNEKVYQVEAGAAHPRDKFPCRVSLSGYVSP
ncbi:cytochrome P450 [Pseudomassariella vexata]|uniref:Cytochrome P450 n=1 Tax=Pseudomassariella vexata TaxID=1141098 RepID=A0A1Y2DHU1_9PEZI|nr:cytochrome P450 [Pseudomassariella vexata]ORY58823.1 cytochrome P450 [Pseudomassariella vexata]